MRPATTIVLGVLLAMIVIAATVQLVLLAH